MQLADFYSLSHEVQFYIPSTQGLAEPISKAQHARRVAEVSAQLAEWYGGATEGAKGSRGVYIANDKQVVRENVLIVYSKADADALKAHEADLLKFTQEKREEWAQESIMLEVDGTGYLIDR